METGEKPQPATLLKEANMKINEIKQMMMMWPANILANNLMINEAGLVNTAPKNSTKAMMGFMAPGTGGLKMCAQ